MLATDSSMISSVFLNATMSIIITILPHIYTILPITTFLLLYIATTILPQQKFVLYSTTLRNPGYM